MDMQDQIGFSDGQYDMVNAKNYEITYTNKNGTPNIYPLIAHGSFDSVERWIFKLVTKAIKNKGFIFPLWLCPIHLRILTKDEKNLSLLEEEKKKVAHDGIRLDIDNRKKNISKKLNDSLTEWIPFSIILPDNFLSFEEQIITVIKLDHTREQVYINNIYNQIKNILQLVTTIN